MATMKIRPLDVEAQFRIEELFFSTTDAKGIIAPHADVQPVGWNCRSDATGKSEQLSSQEQLIDLNRSVTEIYDQLRSLPVVTSVCAERLDCISSLIATMT